jgi:hypothetical protein
VIRVLAGRQAILRRLGTMANSWAGRAHHMTEENRRAGRHVRNTNIWSELKDGLVELQQQKCAYCERRLGSAGIEWAVDHFRPKGRISARKSLLANATDVGGDSDVGYYLLAYDADNYVVACLTCSARKANGFPTGRDRRPHTADPAELAQENAYLINPADRLDLDPEHAIAWRGPIPTPGQVAGFDRLRALVTIDVLGLAREDLVRDRILVILGVLLAHQGTAAGPDVAMLDALCGPASQHAGCARYFRRLCETDLQAAHAELANLRAILLPTAR